MLKLKDYTKVIRKKIDDNYIVVDNPDHPFLSLTPDILIGGNGNLSGIFIPNKNENNNPDNLLVRLALSRLAFPDNFKCILFINNDEKYSFSIEKLYHNFHAVFGNDDLKSIDKFLDDIDYKGPASDIPKGIRERVYLKSRIYYKESLKKLSQKEKSIKPKEIISQVKKDRGWEYPIYRNWYSDDRNRYNSDKKMIFKDNLIISEMSNYTLKKLNSLCISSTKLNYSLDNGVPYPNLYNNSVNVILVDELPYNKYDPNKPLRVACFAGWTLAKVDSIEELNSTEKWISKFERKVKLRYE